MIMIILIKTVLKFLWPKFLARIFFEFLLPPLQLFFKDLIRKVEFIKTFELLFLSIYYVIYWLFFCCYQKI